MGVEIQKLNQKPCFISPAASLLQPFALLPDWRIYWFFKLLPMHYFIIHCLNGCSSFIIFHSFLIKVTFSKRKDFIFSFPAFWDLARPPCLFYMINFCGSEAFSLSSFSTLGSNPSVPTQCNSAKCTEPNVFFRALLLFSPPCGSCWSHNTLDFEEKEVR